MKKSFSTVIAVFLFCVSASYSQFSFGVGTTLGSTGTYFGYQFNDFVPYIGLQYFSAGMTLERSGWHDAGSGNLIPYTDKSEASVSVFMPALGVKYFVKYHKDIRAYVNASFFKPFISLKAEDSGESSPAVKEINDNLSFWGFNAGFGTEYFFSPQFSLGGEFGLNMLFGSAETVEGGEEGDPNPPTTYKPKLDMGVTYGKITLNYYFAD